MANEVGKHIDIFIGSIVWCRTVVRRKRLSLQEKTAMNTIWIVMPILIVLMFQLGIELDVASFRQVARHPKAVAAGIIGQLVFLPVIAFIVAVAFKLPAIAFIGLLLVACCPGGSSSNVFSMLAKGNVALSVTLTALSSVLTLVTIPVIMEFITRFVSLKEETVISLPVGRLLMQNIVLVFLPMISGTVFRLKSPVLAKQVGAVLGRLAFPALMLLAGIFFIQYAKEIIDNIGVLGVSCGTLILAAMGCGAILVRMFRLDKASKRTIVIEVGMQNAAQAIAMAVSPQVFNNGEMAIPAIVYALLMNVILLTYLAVIRRKVND